MRGEEADEEVQNVDAQPVRDYIEAMDEVDAEGVDEEDDEGAYPPARGVRGRLVEVVLQGMGVATCVSPNR